MEGSVSTEGQAERVATETKRKYRRHPKPDDNAPERPPSAYVLFSNHIREEIKGKDLSFTDIAKLVGQRWQALSASEREPYETRAASLKETFNQHLVEYKKSDQYKQYTQYLAEFRAKHGGGVPDGKRPKLEEEASGGSSGSPVVPTLSSLTPKSVETTDIPRQGANTETSRNAPTNRITGTAWSGVNSPVSNPSEPYQRTGSAEGPHRLSGPSLEQTQGVTARSRGLDRTSPSEPGGYFDPLARHARGGPSTAPPGNRPPPLFDAVGSQPAQGPKPPTLTHESSVSSAPSTLSYGSASSGLPWTPQTPRDEGTSSRVSVPDIFHGKGPAGWDAPRPILPPFQGQPGGTFSALQPLKIPDRSFAHPTEPSLRLPPPNASVGSGPPPPQFLDQHRASNQRGEHPQEGPYQARRREESGIDLLARVVDAEQREKRAT